MPTDHPDGTRSIVISRADIQMPIDVQHQTTNVDTDFKAQSVGMYPQSEWAAKEGTDKELLFEKGDLAAGAQASASYHVPAGKTLYITCFGCYVHATEATDRDTNHIVNCLIYDFVPPATYQYKGVIGGNGGCGLSLTKPVVIDAAHYLELMVRNGSNHEVAARAFAGGFEL